MALPRDLEVESSSEPGGRRPAPGALAQVQAFVNTNDREAGHDVLDSPARLRAWLNEKAGLDVGPVTRRQYVRAIALREAMRALAIANAGGRAGPEPLDIVNAEAERTRLGLEFEPDAVRPRSAATGFDGFVAGLLEAVAQSMINGSWGRLKACRRDACQWVFFDRSPNAAAAWCDMRICGSREKAKTYYRRRSRDGARGRQDSPERASLD